MKKFITEDDEGLEVGAGAGFSKRYIKNKRYKISDFSSEDHLDLKEIDAQDTKLESNKYEFVIASNMLHHVPYPIKFLNEMFRILKPGGKLIYTTCSILPEENQDQINWFCGKFNNFSIMSIKETREKLFNSTYPSKNEFIQLSPAQTNTDGFFCAILKNIGK